MTSEESEREARAGATTAPAPDAAGGAAAAEMTAAAAAEAASVETVAGAATPKTLAGAATPTPETLAAATPETLAGTVTPAPVQPTTDPAAAVDARDTTLPLSSPPPEEGARLGSSLETIKTAVVWLVVIQILTILSPLLPVSLKWLLVVGLVLTLSSFAVAAVAYLKARRAQRGLPE